MLRKYILEIRKALGDRPDNPEFIETLPKRGYRFVAPVLEESTAEPPVVPTSPGIEESATEENVGPAMAPPEQERSSGKYRRWEFAVLPVLAVLATAIIAGQYFRVAQIGVDATSLKNTSIAVLPFADMSAAKDQEYFSDGLADLRECGEPDGGASGGAGVSWRCG